MPRDFTSETGREAGKRSGRARRERSTKGTIAEHMRTLLDMQDDEGNPLRLKLAKELVKNMHVSPEWYKLGLKMIGELPPDQLEVSKPKSEMADEVEAEISALERELNAE